MSQRLLSLAAAALLAACVSTGFDRPLEAPRAGMADLAEPRARIWVDEAAREVVVFAGPFDVPAATEPEGPREMGGHVHGATDDHGGGHGHGDHMKSPLIPLVWPVDAGLQGFRLAAYTSEGRPLPREIMHHMIAVNFDRRQLVYPIPERIFGFGTETPDIRLPDFFEIPLERGDSLGMYAMWNNDTGRDLDGVYMHVVLPFGEPGADPESVMPIYVDTNNHIGGKTSFDLPPGRSVRSYEFTLPVDGGLLAAGGHLHDYGVELRLEDAWTGEVLVRLEGRQGPDGRLEEVEQKIFRSAFGLLDRRIPLEAGRPYRVVGTYDNPTGEVIADGGMAHIVGLFAPEDPSAWPAIDRTLDAYALDVEALPAPLERVEVAGEGPPASLPSRRPQSDGR